MINLVHDASARCKLDQRPQSWLEFKLCNSECVLFQGVGERQEENLIRTRVLRIEGMHQLGSDSLYFLHHTSSHLRSFLQTAQISTFFSLFRSLTLGEKKLLDSNNKLK